MVTLAQQINDLVYEYGSLRAAAKALDIDVGYLSRLRSGEKIDPSDEVLQKLGLRKVSVYVLLAENG